jgi:acetyltransferase-like isoleucine patch superfamily enzyme
MSSDNNWDEETYHFLDHGLMKSFWKYVMRVTGERSFSRFLRQGLILTLLSGFPTVIGSVLRGSIYRSLFGSMGSNCFIEKNVRFYAPQRIHLGSRVFIGEGSFIDAAPPGSVIYINDNVHISQGVVIRGLSGTIVIDEMVNVGTGSFIYGAADVRIGRYSLLANNVELITGDHVFKDPSTPIRFQGRNIGNIVIGEDVWLGARVTVLHGITIGKGSVVGANAVVTQDIPSYSVAAGNPATVIRKRESKRS